jgi:GTP-binding protein
MSGGRKHEDRRTAEERAEDAAAAALEPPRSPLLGTVAIVGFPNVGKSTLINRLTQTRAAVVHDMPGVTRDRKELICEWSGERFRIIDTGGVDIASGDPIVQGIARQAKAAIDEADMVLFVVDARHGITPGDEEIAAIIRASKKPVVLIANKIDDPRKDLLALEFHRLGIGEPFPLSALHGHGTGDLLDLIIQGLPGDAGQEVGDEAIRVAILGRPNVGKSSLLNALVGGDRVLVSEIPGTTRDAIDTVLVRGEQTFILVDTAGLRRKRHQRQGVEYYSELRALDAASRADVALVLIDAEQGLVEQDLAVADEARKAQCSTLVVLSKWDVSNLVMEEIRPEVTARLRQRPPVVAVSAKTGRGLQKMLDRVEELGAKHQARIPTPELNRFLGELRLMRQAPSKGQKKLNLLYGTQVQTRPPRIKIFVNDPGLVTRDYGYWVENQFRERFGLQGVPVSIDFVLRG